MHRESRSSWLIINGRHTPQAALNAEDLEVLGDRIRADMRAQVGTGDGAAMRRKLQRMFRTLDKDGDGQISTAEFESGLKKLGSPFSGLGPAERAVLAGGFDRRGCGKVNFADFVAFVAPGSEDADLVERKVGNVVRMVRKYHSVNVLSIFEEYDEAGQWHALIG